MWFKSEEKTSPENTVPVWSPAAMESKKHKKTNKEKDNNKPKKVKKPKKIVPAVGGDNTFSEAKPKQTKNDKTRVPAVGGEVAPVSVSRILISPLPD